MVKYDQSIIYKLCCRDPTITDIYIGSTTNRNRRKQQHKNNCNNENIKGYNCYVYQFIRDNGGWNNWDFVMIETYNASDKSDLHKRERHWIEELKSTLNKQLPTRTKNEYAEAYKEKFKDYRKQYNEANKDKIKEQTSQYYEQNKDKIKDYNKQYNEQNKDTIKDKFKEWYQKNMNTVKEQKKEWYQKNMNIIKEQKKEYREQNKEIVNCPCGGRYDKSQQSVKTKHYNTMKHKTYTSMTSIDI